LEEGNLSAKEGVELLGKKKKRQQLLLIVLEWWLLPKERSTALQKEELLS
jgi:hypothetical protein